MNEDATNATTVPNNHVSVDDPSDPSDPSDPKTCTKCMKTFSQTCKMIKHSEKCKGICNKSQCQYCLKVFASPAGKCNHTRICKMKPVDPEPPVIDTMTVLDTTAVIEKRFEGLIKYLDDKGDKIDDSDREELKCILTAFKEILIAIQ